MGDRRMTTFDKDGNASVVNCTDFPVKVEAHGSFSMEGANPQNIPKKRGRRKGKATGREVYMIVNDTTILPGTVNEYQGICIGAFCRNDPAGDKPFNPEKAWDKLKKLGWRCAKFREVV